MDWDICPLNSKDIRSHLKQKIQGGSQKGYSDRVAGRGMGSNGRKSSQNIPFTLWVFACKSKARWKHYCRWHLILEEYQSYKCWLA